MNTNALIAMCLMVAVAVGGLAFVAGGLSADDFMKRKAIEHGCASYDPQTGAWGWKP